MTIPVGTLGIAIVGGGLLWFALPISILGYNLVYYSQPLADFDPVVGAPQRFALHYDTIAQLYAALRR